MALNKQRMYGKTPIPNQQVMADGTQGPSRMNSTPAKFDGRARTNGGTDRDGQRNRSYDPSPSITHWTKTS